jgi:transcriptional regulator with XRE-family HTH domain
MELGKIIKIGRINAGMGQKDLGEALGVGIVTVSNWERGIRKPSLNQLSLLYKVLNLSKNEIMDTIGD